MTFLYPIGLLGLVGIPILILVYIIKNRYTEQTVASTYLWRLSERFLKKRNPLTKLTGIISLILQLLLIATLSLSVAHPIINLPGAAREYCFILDGSASMNMEAEGESRFDLAKNEIRDQIKSAKDGSSFTLIYVGDTTEVIVERNDDVSRVIERLESLKCSSSAVSFNEALGIAQGYFDDNTSLITYLVTDSACSDTENVRLINVSRSELNVSIDDLAYVRTGKDTVTVSGTVISYGADTKVKVELFKDEETSALSYVDLDLINGVESRFTLELLLGDFYSLTARVSKEDSYALDNETTVYNIESENSYNALIVSDSPFLIKSAIETVSSAKITVMSTKDYKNEEDRLASNDKLFGGYSLYIFDGYSPARMPEDGAVWFFGIDSNVSGSGFSVQGEVKLESGSSALAINKSTSSTVRRITAGMVGDDIYISRYIKYGVYADFTTIYSYKANPVVFTGINDHGNREVVFAFSIHDTDMSLSIDYLALISNLLGYSFPEVIETAEYYCGESATINVVSGCESIRVSTPSGQIIYADVSRATSEFLLNEVGEYTVTVNISGAQRPAYYLYSSVPKEERNVSVTLDYVGLNGEATDKGSDGRYDPSTLLFILAAIMFTAEWMVYCYDKYQLR